MSTGAVLRLPEQMSQRDLLGGQAVLASALALALITALDATDGHLGSPFAVGFVLICATAPVAARVDQLFAVIVAPPLLLAATVLVLSAAWPGLIHLDGVPSSAGVLGRAIAKLVDLGVLLLVAHLLALLTTVARILTAPQDDQPRISST